MSGGFRVVTANALTSKSRLRMGTVTDDGDNIVIRLRRWFECTRQATRYCRNVVHEYYSRGVDFIIFHRAPPSSARARVLVLCLPWWTRVSMSAGRRTLLPGTRVDSLVTLI